MTAPAIAFVPSVVLLVHESGEAVRGHLASILELTGPLGRRTAGIELLHVEAAGDALEARTVPWGPPGPEAPPGGETVDLALAAAVQRVRGWRVRDGLERAGYTVSSTVQVLVVGAADDPCVGEIMAIAPDALRGQPQPVAVCSLLDGAARPAGPRPAAGLDLLFTDWISFPAPAHVDDSLRRYAVAQALFTLIATGLALEPSFAQLLVQRSARAGSLRSCLVAFPRAAVERSCAAGLGREVVQVWRRTLGRPMATEEAAAERALADQAFREIRQWLDDAEMRPGSDPDGAEPGTQDARHRWPPLDVLRTTLAHQQLVSASERLFGLFAHPDVDREAADRPLHAWADVAYERAGQAPDQLVRWRPRAEAAWAPLAELLVARTREQVNGLWATGDRRLARLQRFVEQCDVQLTQLVVAVTGQRELHVRRYLDELDAARGLAYPWWSRLGEPALGDGGGAEPTYGPPRRTGERPPPPPPSDSRPGEDGEARVDLGNRLTRREDRIAKALRERVRDFHALVSPWRAVVTSILLAFAALLPAGALLPARVASVPLAGLTAMGVLAAAAVALGVSAHAVLRGWRRWRARRAERDLLRFLCLCYAHRCERLEDRRRLTSLGPLRWWVQRTLRALEEVDAFFGRVRAQLEDVEQRVESGLFDEPSGALDVLVAEGRQLVRAGEDEDAGAGQVTLDGVLRAVSRRLGADGEPETLANDFLGTLEDGTSLLEMDEEVLRDDLIAFLRDRLRDGVRADVHGALLGPAVQRRASQHLESPLFPQRGRMQPRERYVHGRLPTQDERGLPAGRLLHGEQDEWWLLAAVFVDGGGTEEKP